MNVLRCVENGGIRGSKRYMRDMPMCYMFIVMPRILTMMMVIDDLLMLIILLIIPVEKEQLLQFKFRIPNKLQWCFFRPK